MAATQGVYNSVKIRKTSAVNGVNSVFSAPGIAAQQDGQSGNNAFLGGKAGDQRSGNAPVAKAKGLEDGGDQAANQSQKAGIRGGSNIQAGVERL